MKHHPDGELIRRILCGPIGSAKHNKLTDPADNARGHNSKRLSNAPRAEPAPAALLTPAAAAGVFLDPSFAHAAITTSQEQQKS